MTARSCNIENKVKLVDRNRFREAIFSEGFKAKLDGDAGESEIRILPRDKRLRVVTLELGAYGNVME